MLCASALAGGAAVAAASGPGDVAAAVAGEVVQTAAREEPEDDGAQRLVFDPMVVVEGGADSFGHAFADGMPITGATPHRLVLFTFDDGPDHVQTPRLLDMLDEAGVRAVFFLTASRMRGDNRRERQHQAIARDIVQRGHMVGNHTLDHAMMPALTPAEMRRQLAEAERIFEDVLGDRPFLFRPPGGQRSERVDAIAAQRGYTTMLWNLGTGDVLVGRPVEVLGTFTRVFERRRSDHGDRGGIVLLHDIHEHSVDAFPRIVAFLRERNCELLDEGEELFDIVDDPRLFFVPRADAPPSMDAPPALPDPAILAARQQRLRKETHERCTALAQR